MANKSDSNLEYADSSQNTNNSTTNNSNVSSSSNSSSGNQGDKLNWFNKEKTPSLYKAADLDKNVPEGTVRIYTHGAPDRLIGPDGIAIKTPEQFDKVLMKNSEVWRNYKASGGTIKVELMACQTGRWGNGIASKLSQAFKNSEFIAPTTKFFATTFSNGSVYSDIAGRFNILNPGRWNHFIDGINLTGIFDKYKNFWRQYPSIKWH